MKSLENKNIIVTGGGRGIGASACKLLAKVGANVIITCRTEKEGLAVEKDILDLVDFIISSNATYITGQNIEVAGGYMMSLDSGLT